MKVAIVHYWLVGMRGGERVLEELCAMFPDAHIYTHVVDRTALSPALAARDIRTSFIARLPWARQHYQKYLLLMPWALEQLDLQEYDLVISSESGPAKGVICRPDAMHVCYCHSPMRYIWDLSWEYQQSAGWFGRTLLRVFAPFLRVWDVSTSARVDRFVANSAFVSQRIQKFYRRSADVVPPPVAVEDFDVAEPEDYFLWVGQLAAYKRPLEAIAACRQRGVKLKLIGDGELADQVRELASDDVEYLGAVNFSQLKHHLARCRALLFPGIEDFGIVPVEAMASGRPVIALGRGGALDSVIHGETGWLYSDDSVSGLAAAIDAFAAGMEQSMDSDALVNHAQSFSAGAFRLRMSKHCTP